MKHRELYPLSRNYLQWHKISTKPESLCCTLEINGVLEINYALTENKKAPCLKVCDFFFFNCTKAFLVYILLEVSVWKLRLGTVLMLR